MATVQPGDLVLSLILLPSFCVALGTWLSLSGQGPVFSPLQVEDRIMCRFLLTLRFCVSAR